MIMEDNKSSYSEVSLKDNKVFKWLDNYWYHYKWHTIITLFFVIIAIVCIVQMVKKTEPDAIITYAGGYAFEVDDTKNLQEFFKTKISSDLNNDGKIFFSVQNYYLPYGVSNDSQNSKNFSNLMLTGQSAVLFVSEAVYNSLKENDRLVPLDNSVVSLPKNLPENDGYSFCLGDLPIYQNNEELQILPGDTRVCLARKVINVKDEDYSLMKSTFRAIVSAK